MTAACAQGRLAIDRRRTTQSDPPISLPGHISSWGVAVLERSLLRFVKSDERLGREDSLFALLQEAGLRILDETTEQVVVCFSVGGKPFQSVADP